MQIHLLASSGIDLGGKLSSDPPALTPAQNSSPDLPAVAIPFRQQISSTQKMIP
jgi:hypothetical protein